MIADDRGYDDIIEGIVTTPDEKEDLEITDEDDAAAKKSKKEKQLARAANKKGFRDLVMSTEGISLNIVENSTSVKLTRGDLKKAWGRLERCWNSKTREDKVQFYTKLLHYKLENVKQRPMDWLAFMEKKRNELANTGHIMKTSKELSEEETYYHNDSHTMFHDQRLYEGEKTQQDHEDMESISDESKVQKDWPRKCFQMDKKEPNESALMCWESLDDSEQASKKRKTHAQDKETNDKADEMDDKMHTKHTANTGIQLNIPVDDLKLGADDDASMLATQETSVENLVYIMNIPEGKLCTTKNV